MLTDTQIEEKGLKEDKKGKSRVDLIPPEMILALGDVLAYGADKYKPNSWQNVENPIDTHYGAMMRHLLQWRSGEIYDKESGLSHMLHAFSNAMFCLYHERRFKIGEKNRDTKDNIRE